MTDLDKQVAEAQGWKIVELLQGPTWDDTDERGFHNALLVSGYTPSTDLNQAVAFAEWFCDQMECGYDLDRYHKDLPDSGKYRVRVGGYTLWSKDNLAEALCQAVLKALGEKRV